MRFRRPRNLLLVGWKSTGVRSSRSVRTPGFLHTSLPLVLAPHTYWIQPLRLQPHELQKRWLHAAGLACLPDPAGRLRTNQTAMTCSLCAAAALPLGCCPVSSLLSLHCSAPPSFLPISWDHFLNASSHRTCLIYLFMLCRLTLLCCISPRVSSPFFFKLTKLYT